jgi:hypothetical protein
VVWQGTIERAITVIDEAPFLSKQQKRDIFYNNAAHCLRLSREVIARHHNCSESSPGMSVALTYPIRIAVMFLG